MKKQNNIPRHALSLCVLVLSFLLCRFVCFDLHGMIQWPAVLFAVGLGALGVSFLAKGRLVPLFISLAYPIGFAAGVIFQSDGVDPGGGRTNNLWIIWTAAFLSLSVLGLIAELAVRGRKK